jgi:RNA polymerase sigma factor (sigma-70 family)
MESADAQLVELARVGNRDAFAQIVRRYQNLICSIAYAITGSLEASEEVAQEAFIAAWQSIAQLQEPDKLRQWMCGIVRNIANNRGRRQQRDLLHQADTLDATHVDGSAVDPAASSIAREEADLLDRTLHSLPIQYREPLVLYYREQQSVALVAELLELSPNTVKQRLARGRELLRNEIAAVVERGLLNSSPGNTFTFTVLAALPVLSGSAKTATVTLATAKGAAATNAAGLGGLVGAIAGPLAGVMGGWFGYRASMNAAGSDPERAFIKGQSLRFILYIGAFVIGISGLLLLHGWLKLTPMQLTLCVATLFVVYVVGLLGLILWTNRRLSHLQRAHGAMNIAANESQTGAASLSRSTPVRRSYQSPVWFLGLPLLSIELGGGQGLGASRPAVAKGWIAIGDIACGGLLAFGNLAIGTVAMGAISVGAIGLGGVGIGALAFGGMALGGYAVGGLAFGWAAFGGLAIAWHSAIGGMAMAHDIAAGGMASAAHANDEIATAFMNESRFVQAGKVLNRFGWIPLVAIILLPIYLVRRFAPTTSLQDAQSVED